MLLLRQQSDKKLITNNFIQRVRKTTDTDIKHIVFYHNVRESP